MFFPFFLESGAAFGCGRLFFGGGGDVPPFLPVPDLLQRARGGDGGDDNDGPLRDAIYFCIAARSRRVCLPTAERWVVGGVVDG